MTSTGASPKNAAAGGKINNLQLYLPTEDALAFRVIALWACRHAVSEPSRSQQGTQQLANLHNNSSTSAASASALALQPNQGPVEIFGPGAPMQTFTAKGLTIGDHDFGRVVEITQQACGNAIEACLAERNGYDKDRELAWRRFLNTISKLFDTQDFAESLRTHVRWMLWNMAWRQVNINDHLRTHTRIDGMKVELHFDQLINYKISPLLTYSLGHGRVEGNQNDRGVHWRGVNLGGWFLLENWMNSNVRFEQDEHMRPVGEDGAPCDDPMNEPYDYYPDEWSICKWLIKDVGPKGVVETIEKHRKEWITRDDFKQMKRLGLNSVRVPIGYWLVTGPRPGEPFVGPSISHLDNCVRWGQDEGLEVVISMHSLPGFQSGHQSTGRENDHWRVSDWDIESSLEVIKIIANRYKNSSVTGICVCNEPSNKIPFKTLLDFYRRSIAVIRQADPQINVLLPIYQRDFEPFAEEEDLVNDPRIIFDLHLYQCFGEYWESMSLAEHLQRSLSNEGHWPGIVDITMWGAKCVVSEWSVRLPTWERSCLAAREWKALDPEDRDLVSKSFGHRQVAAFHTLGCMGWFFWTWKVDADGEEPWWSWKEGAEQGWLIGVEKEVSRRLVNGRLRDVESRFENMEEEYPDLDLPAAVEEITAVPKRRRRSIVVHHSDISMMSPKKSHSASPRRALGLSHRYSV